MGNVEMLSAVGKKREAESRVRLYPGVNVPDVLRNISIPDATLSSELFHTTSTRRIAFWRESTSSGKEKNKCITLISKETPMGLISTARFKKKHGEKANNGNIVYKTELEKEFDFDINNITEEEVFHFRDELGLPPVSGIVFSPVYIKEKDDRNGGKDGFKFVISADRSSLKDKPSIPENVLYTVEIEEVLENGMPPHFDLIEGVHQDVIQSLKSQNVLLTGNGTSKSGWMERILIKEGKLTPTQKRNKQLTA